MFKRSAQVVERALAEVVGAFEAHAGDKPEFVVEQLDVVADVSGGDGFLEILGVGHAGLIDGGRAGGEPIGMGFKEIIILGGADPLDLERVVEERLGRERIVGKVVVFDETTGGRGRGERPRGELGGVVFALFVDREADLEGHGDKEVKVAGDVDRSALHVGGDFVGLAGGVEQGELGVVVGVEGGAGAGGGGELGRAAVVNATETIRAHDERADLEIADGAEEAVVDVVTFVPAAGEVGVGFNLVEFAIVEVVQNGGGRAARAVTVGHALTNDVVTRGSALGVLGVAGGAGAPHGGEDILTSGRVDLDVFDVEAERIFAVELPIKGSRGELALGGLEDVLLQVGRLDALDHVPGRRVVVHVVDAHELAKIKGEGEGLVNGLSVVDIDAGLDGAGIRAAVAADLVVEAGRTETVVGIISAVGVDLKAATRAAETAFANDVHGATDGVSRAIRRGDFGDFDAVNAARGTRREIEGTIRRGRGNLCAIHHKHHAARGQTADGHARGRLGAGHDGDTGRVFEVLADVAVAEVANFFEHDDVFDVGRELLLVDRSGGGRQRGGFDDEIFELNDALVILGRLIERKAQFEILASRGRRCDGDLGRLRL